MNKITKTTVCEYDKDGKLIKKTETTVEEKFEEDGKINPASYIKDVPYVNPTPPWISPVHYINMDKASANYKNTKYSANNRSSMSDTGANIAH